jgi:hypothetical protein
MSAVLQGNDGQYDPLDLAELVFLERDWSFDRASDGELIAETNGSWCKYHVWFTWQEDCGGLTLSCSMESKFPRAMLFKVHSLLAMANEKIWLGHFDISTEECTIVFRHSMLLRDGAGTTAEHLQEVLDIAVAECERFYPAFQSVIWGDKSPSDAIKFALFETVGEA